MRTLQANQEQKKIDPDSEQAVEVPKVPVTPAAAGLVQTPVATQTTQISSNSDKGANEKKAPTVGCQNKSTEQPRSKIQENQEKDTDKDADKGTGADADTRSKRKCNVIDGEQGNLTTDPDRNAQTAKEGVTPCPDDDDTASENNSSPLAKKTQRKSKRKKANNK